MKRLARIGARWEPIESPSIWSYISLLKIKCVSDVAILNKFLKFFSSEFNIRIIFKNGTNCDINGFF